jgi:hypothetical protein
MRRLLVLTLASFALAAPSAEAHQSPAGCFASRLEVKVTRNPAVVRHDAGVGYTVAASNVGEGACDITNATITLSLPGVDGLPSGEIPLAQGLDLPAGSVERVVGTRQWIASVNPGVTDAIAQVSSIGTLHDSAVNHTASIMKTIGASIVDPKIGLAVTADPATGPAPLTVTYHFTLTNLSTPPAALASPTVTFQLCGSPVVSAGGDTNTNGAIDGGEVWDLTCTRLFAAPGEYAATTAVSATSAAGGDPVTANAPATTIKATAPVSTAHLTLTKVASPAIGIAPLSVTYTYTVLNDGPSTPIAGITVDDAGCDPVTTSEPKTPLAAGASRIFTCEKVYPTAGTFLSGAVASGTDTVTNTLVSSAEVRAEVTASLPPDPEPTPTALPSEPTPVATAIPTPTPTPTTRVTFAYTGRFTPARSCRGTVTLTLKAGTKTVASKRVKLDSKCRYKVSLVVLRTRLGTAKKVTVTAKAGQRTASRQLLIPKR